MSNRILLSGIGLLLLVSPITASAVTIQELQAQLQQLMALIAQLQRNAPAFSASACVNLSYNMGPDDTDADTNGEVTKLQQFLAQDPAIYPEARITGYYGPATTRAVQRWQKAHGLVSSGDPDSTGYGYVGPKTREAMRCGNSISPVEPLPNALSASPAYGVAPLTVTLSASGIGSSGKYHLEYGDGEEGLICNQDSFGVARCGAGWSGTHTYRNPGTYTAVLSIAATCATGQACPMSLQQVGTATITINSASANPAPTLSFTATPTRISAGQSSTLQWSTANVQSCASTGAVIPIPIAANASVQVSPTQSATYTLTCTGAGGTVTKSVTVTLHEPLPQASGWDYNLTKKCIKSVSPGDANYYSDTADCGAQGKHWTVAVQSEKEYGVSSVGPNTQSFAINQPGSPMTMQWLPHTDEQGRANYAVNLKTDFGTNTHPAGAGNFTWFAFMDHVNHDGGPLPRPDKLRQSATVSFNDYVPNGATRAIIALQGFWNGKSHLVEINLYTSPSWGDANPDADIINVVNSSALNFINMDGRAMGISIPKNQDTPVSVDWKPILDNLISRGYLPSPTGGWENTATQAVFIASEVKNDTPDASAIADLWFTNFRVESK